MSKLFFKNLLYKQPLSLRGALTLLFCYLVLAHHALPEHDLVAYVLGGAGLLLLSYLLPVLLSQRFWLAKKIKTSVQLDSKNLFSKTNISSGINISGVSLSTLFRLKVERIFLQKNVQAGAHIIRGKFTKNSQQELLGSIYFPHRGLWDLSHLEFTISDAFGLTRLSWNKKISTQFEISAKPISIEALPLVISSAQSGDQLNQNVERAGDLYDIKAYDPSDGTKHILWKTYAKSRQLVVRRPEPAVIPEGEVALYLVAEKEDDDLAAALLDYIEQLNKRNIVTFFSTDGLKGEIFDRADKINTAINESVWHQDAGSALGLSAYLEKLIERKSNIREVLVFAKLTNSVVSKLQETMSRHQIVLTICALQEDAASEKLKKELQNSGLRVLTCKRI